MSMNAVVVSLGIVAALLLVVLLVVMRLMLCSLESVAYLEVEKMKLEREAKCLRFVVFAFRASPYIRGTRFGYELYESLDRRDWRAIESLIEPLASVRSEKG